jgi:RNA polymerase sigma-70 factor (ECF subfamily)
VAPIPFVLFGGSSPIRIKSDAYHLISNNVNAGPLRAFRNPAGLDGRRHSRVFHKSKAAAGSINRLEIHLSSKRVFVPLSDVDRRLLTQCFQKRPFAWEGFVDRYLMLIVFVVKHTARRRQMRLTEHDDFELVSDVFLTLMRDDFAILRRFRGKSSLATYLAVVTRRVVVRKLVRLVRNSTRQGSSAPSVTTPHLFDLDVATAGEIDAILNSMDPRQASLVRMYHLERKSLEQISAATGIAIESIGPMLEQAREKLEPRNGVNQGA